MSNKERPLILVSNDDGVSAKGLFTLIDVVKPYGDVVVVAPEKAESGMSHAISISTPLRIKTILKEKGLKIYSVNGTPVDCVKLALNQLLDRKPDVVVSGINHGSNASISVIYSGTMGAAIEGCLNDIPSAGFSLLNHSRDADFSMVKFYAEKIFKNLLTHKLPTGVALNINFPDIPKDKIKGIKTCKMTKGVWKEEYDKRIDPHKRTYYWLTGSFKNFEPDEQSTDEWALSNNYIAVVPVRTDWTAYDSINMINKWNYEI